MQGDPSVRPHAAHLGDVLRTNPVEGRGCRPGVPRPGPSSSATYCGSVSSWFDVTFELPHVKRPEHGLATEITTDGPPARMGRTPEAVWFRDGHMGNLFTILSIFLSVSNA